MYLHVLQLQMQLQMQMQLQQAQAPSAQWLVQPRGVWSILLPTVPPVQCHARRRRHAKTTQWHGSWRMAALAHWSRSLVAGSEVRRPCMRDVGRVSRSERSPPPAAVATASNAGPCRLEHAEAMHRRQRCLCLRPASTARWHCWSVPGPAAAALAALRIACAGAPPAPPPHPTTISQ